MSLFYLSAIANGSIYGFYLATYLEGTIEQQTAYQSNLFDLEIAKLWEMILLPGDCGTCRWKPTPDCYVLEYSRYMWKFLNNLCDNLLTPEIASLCDLCKLIEPAFPGTISRSSLICLGLSLLYMNSEEDPLLKSTDVGQECSTLCSLSSGGTFDIYTSYNEDSLSSSLSSILL